MQFCVSTCELLSKPVCLNINLNDHIYALRLIKARWTNKQFHFTVNIKLSVYVLKNIYYILN
jgi:hypothetical protein